MKEATIYTFGLIVGPSFGLAAEAERRFEVIHDGGGPGAAGDSVHRVVELPTDPASPARAIADEVNLALSSTR
jgi:hypothetical protein